jgi:hypothetical protein
VFVLAVGDAYPGSGGLLAALTSFSTNEVYTSFTLGSPLM